MANETEAERIAREDRRAEEKGGAWQQYSDAFLVGYVAEINRPGQFHTPAIVEMQRRLAVATRAAGDCAGEQTAHIIKMTATLQTLTYVLVAIGVLQTVVLVWSLLPGGAR